ncbi:hypothetical protein [Kibdelosporangium aridum]|uniref:hypothetical protein n=1 Tax=Kibdelosporangium aridum TaxID=2030 RepID=UPI0035EB4A74
MPEVTFEDARRPNRVYTQDGYSKLIRFRMNAIVSETGGITGINYAEPECAFGTAMPANAKSNTMRCFPAKWSAPNSPDRTDYFHKYVVSQVTVSTGSEAPSPPSLRTAIRRKAWRGTTTSRSSRRRRTRPGARIAATAM